MSAETGNWPIALPTRIDGGYMRRPTPLEALRGLLISHPLALSTLSEARHRAVLAANSAAEAGRAARRARDAELSYEHARRTEDPRGLRSGRFGLVAAFVGLMLLMSASATLALCWGLTWPYRVMLALATMFLAGVVAYALSKRHVRRNVALGLTIAAVLLWVALVLLPILAVAAWSILMAVKTAALGLVVIMPVIAAVLALDHCESLTCGRLRQRSERAGGEREHLAEVAGADQAEAVRTANVWESLVVEECSMVRPAGADAEQWVAECVRIARNAAIPADHVAAAEPVATASGIEPQADTSELA